MCWLVLVMALGCGTTSQEKGEGRPAGADGLYAGEGAMPASERAEIKAETAEQKAEGGFGESESGAGAENEEQHAGLGALYYFYIGLGIVLLVYLLWLIRGQAHRTRSKEELTWRLK